MMQRHWSAYTAQEQSWNGRIVPLPSELPPSKLEAGFRPTSPPAHRPVVDSGFPLKPIWVHDFFPTPPEPVPCTWTRLIGAFCLSFLLLFQTDFVCDIYTWDIIDLNVPSARTDPPPTPPQESVKCAAHQHAHGHAHS